MHSIPTEAAPAVSPRTRKNRFGYQPHCNGVIVAPFQSSQNPNRFLSCASTACQELLITTGTASTAALPRTRESGVGRQPDRNGVFHVSLSVWLVFQPLSSLILPRVLVKSGDHHRKCFCDSMTCKEEWSRTWP